MLATAQFDCDANSNVSECRWSGRPSENVVAQYTVACGDDQYSLSIARTESGDVSGSDFSKDVSLVGLRKNETPVSAALFDAVHDLLEPYGNVVLSFACGVAVDGDNRRSQFDGTLGINITGVLKERSKEARQKCLSSGKYYDERVRTSIIISEDRFHRSYPLGPICVPLDQDSSGGEERTLNFGEVE